MKASEIMTADPCCCGPTASIAHVAELMRANDCGVVPIVDDGCLVGLVTDRDLTVRALAAQKGADTPVHEVMTRELCCCGPNDDVDTVERAMATEQVRRVPVVNDHGRCLGIIAQADLARAASSGQRVSDREVAIVVEAISEPAREELRTRPKGEIADRL